MKSIFFYELKKIFYRRIVRVGIGLLLLFNISQIASLANGDIAYEQEIASRYEGVLDDEKIQEMLEEFMPKKEQLAMWKGIDVAYIGMNSLQQAVHLHFANGDGTWNGKTVQDVFGEEEILVGYHAGWFQLSRNLVKITLILGILAVIMCAPVFAGEYKGMAQILLPSRKGRGTCAIAKILAAFTASLSLMLLFLVGNLTAAAVLMGRSGLDSSTLFCGVSYVHYMPFPISCKTMLIYQIGLSFSGMIMVTGMTVAVSAMAKSQMTALILAEGLFLLPLMVSLPETTPIFRVIGLLPVWQIQFRSLMAIGQIKGNLFYALMAFPVCAGTLGMGTALGVHFWKRHQVSC